MLRMGGTQPVRKGSVPCPGVGWESGDGLGKIRGSEGQSVGLSMAGCGGSGDKGQRGLRGGSHGGWLGKGRVEGGWVVGGVSPLHSTCLQGRAAHLMVVLVRRV